MKPMKRVLVPLIAFGCATVGWLVASAAPPAPAPATPTDCKTYGTGRCCDPAAAAHLPRSAIYAACGESDATFLGEQGSKDACKYFFKGDGEKPDESYVQVYAPPTKDVPPSPNDPFFTWRKVGRVFVTERANSPKSAPMLVGATGLWLPAHGYFVSVNASTHVCTKKEAVKLGAAMK